MLGFYGRKCKIIRQYVADNIGLVRKEANRLACLYGAEEDPETRKDLYNDCLQNGVLGLHRDRSMVEMHYGFHGRPAPFAEIGAAHNVSPQRAERIVKRALAQLRELARERDFDLAA